MGTAARPDYEGLLALVMHKKLPERQELPLSLGVAPEVLPPSKPPESTWVPSVLVIGGPLPDLDRQRLEKRGCQVEVVPDFVEGLKRMDEGRWDVVVVHPHVQADADGLKFVRQFKHLRPEDLPEEFKSVCSRYKHTPFVILPVPETSQFAIFRTSDDWTLADVNKASIAEAILNARTL
ncbi:MAG: hypothetical protein HY897_17640, partial [Deltaproteobacteria bacterium]|nr:hypothetical protein [Deltaproteobacteria bacterium]